MKKNENEQNNQSKDVFYDDKRGKLVIKDTSVHKELGLKRTRIPKSENVSLLERRDEWNRNFRLKNTQEIKI